jgi:hypothetical protein
MEPKITLTQTQEQVKYLLEHSDELAAFIKDAPTFWPKPKPFPFPPEPDPIIRKRLEELIKEFIHAYPWVNPHHCDMAPDIHNIKFRAELIDKMVA